MIAGSRRFDPAIGLHDGACADMTYLQPSTRAILSASVERLPDSSNDGTGVVYYDRLTVPFSDADFTRVKRIEGWAIQAPSNKNFGALIVADRDIQVLPDQATNRVCESNCFIQCKCGQDVCRELVCPAVCAGEEKQFDSAELRSVGRSVLMWNSPVRALVSRAVTNSPSRASSSTVLISNLVQTRANRNSARTE